MFCHSPSTWSDMIQGVAKEIGLDVTVDADLIDREGPEADWKLLKFCVRVV